MSVALVTGPTSGLGHAFARRLANDGYDLVLVARDAKRLSEVAGEFEAAGVSAEVIVADVGERAASARVEARLASSDRPVDVLVNNAGFGLNQPFVGGSRDMEQSAIDVMVTAVMRLTHAAVPGMSQRGQGTIINVSSIASFMPLGSYSAAKSWTTTFSQGLANELSGSGVRVIAVCPGLVRTQFHQRAGMDMARTPEWMWLSTDAVVDQTFADLARGRALSVAGMSYRALSAGTHLLPRTAVRHLAHLRRRAIDRQR